MGPDAVANPVCASGAERTRIDSLVTVSQGRRVLLGAKLKGKVGDWLCLLVVSAATFRAARNRVEHFSLSVSLGGQTKTPERVGAENKVGGVRHPALCCRTLP